MKSMKEPVKTGRKNITHRANKDNPTKQCIERREYLACAGKPGGNHRAHPTQDHGSIMKRIKPFGERPRGPMIADSSNEQHDKQQSRNAYYISCNAPVKYRQRCQRLCSI